MGYIQGGTAFLSIALGDSKFSYTLLAGISLVIVSVFLYTINPTLTAVDDEDFEEVFYSDDEVEAASESNFYFYIFSVSFLIMDF